MSRLLIKILKIKIKIYIYMNIIKISYINYSFLTLDKDCYKITILKRISNVNKRYIILIKLIAAVLIIIEFYF
jgi:hypothetical protein